MTYVDSFLNYMTRLDEKFRLNHLIEIGGDNAMYIPSPVEWISQIQGTSRQDFATRRYYL